MTSRENECLCEAKNNLSYSCGVCSMSTDLIYWLEWMSRNSLMRKRHTKQNSWKMHNGREEERKRRSKSFIWREKIITKIDCFCFFLFLVGWIREAYCDSPKCSFIIRRLDPYNEVERKEEGTKKLCGLLLELTSMHLCHNHKSKHLFYAVHWAWARARSHQFMVFFSTLID